MTWNVEKSIYNFPSKNRVFLGAKNFYIFFCNFRNSSKKCVTLLLTMSKNLSLSYTNCFCLFFRTLTHCVRWVYQNENILQFIFKDVWQLQPRQILSWMKISLENGAGTILEYIVLVSRAHSKYAGGKLGLDVSSIGFFPKRFFFIFLQILW